MTKEEKDRYYAFEDELHQRLLHKQLEERSESAEVLDLSKELVQDTNSMLGKIKIFGEKFDRQSSSVSQLASPPDSPQVQDDENHNIFTPLPA